MDNRKKIVKEHYEPLLDKYAEGYEILDWESRDSQIKRFDVLVDNIDLNGKKILDIGCGTGDLYRYLLDRVISTQYTGIDILEKMIDRARILNPEGRFFTGDIFEESLFSKKQFDIVFCSGIFNLNMGDNESFFRSALPVFFEHAKTYVVFNLLDPGHYVQSNRYYFFHQKDVLHWIRNYSENVIIKEGYVLNDFTIIAQV